MRNYRLSVKTLNQDTEVEEVEASSAAEAAFLLGANFGMAAAFASPVYAMSAEIVGATGTVEIFMEATRDQLASVVVEAL
jgi:hypothetical protein